MYIKTLILLNIVLCIYNILATKYSKNVKRVKKVYINTVHTAAYKLGCSNLIKKKRMHNPIRRNKKHSNKSVEYNEYGMNIKFLKINENKVIENLKKRCMETNINDVMILKNLIDTKNKLEVVRNDLRNKRKLLSDKVKNLIFSEKDTTIKKVIQREFSCNSKKEKKSESSLNNDNFNNSQNNIFDDSNVMEQNEQIRTRHSELSSDEKNEHLQNVNIQKKIEKVKNEMNEINNSIDVSEAKILNLKLKIDEYLNKLPNILLSKVPEGRTANDNKIVKTYKIKNIEINKANTFLESHENIIKRYDNNSIFSNISNKIGFGNNILVNNIAKLERALTVIVSKSALINTGQLPRFENDIFKINSNYKIINEEAYLIPTSEVSLLNLFKNSLVDYEKLPIKLVSHSSCFRIEKNFAYGKTTKGLLREHIFEKVELIAITDRKTSPYYYKDLIKHCEYILKKLKIPYRLVLLNSSETPFSSSVCYDIEAWLPSQKRFIEVSSCSNCLDFQSRKLHLKYKKGNKNFYCHTINGSGLAVGRVLAIILEQYQIQRNSKNEQNQLIIPKPLQRYMNTATINL
ncbi:serine--tRNA ligase, putative [Plasmodium malariae]|uniref:serine--tRNA ligase n=1 Tax=Plasmodium malariae TaxID=5858 RepID=A0A1C3L2T6_PLAMA|nr:serine--tRNA ligase, putative [Plasmodium malariae]